MTNGEDGHAIAVFEGIYDVPEVARYLLASRSAAELYRVNSRHLIRWIRHGLASPDLVATPGRELIITFEDLVSMRVIAALRAANVKFTKIYEAEDWLRKETGHTRPFATEVLWTEGSEVFAEMSRRLLSATRHGQLAMDLIREFLIPIHGLTFNESHLADSWQPINGVLLHPLIQFGSPCIKDTRIPTRSIWGMVEAGDSPDWVARAYQLSEGEVRTAIDWESRLAA